ncbi:LOW QUALITY PROTEIN: hypothetical protein MSG28_011858 [Choristoneura fumiferana]|uniref:Uncharacterized protein n=1 Tax=Choristoneura fumiferana TaxID=7141 RepID=A0ACC0KMP9_CHOFU|nr:LOW QUALITY PROTEIN: hypothetical protein MSG28_011858 [Choristoneura fumiferana]
MVMSSGTKNFDLSNDETPTLSSKLCTNPKNAYLCDLLDYTNATRICSMKPAQCIEISDWVSCAGGLPLGSNDISPVTEFDVEVLLECEMEPHESTANHLISLDSMGLPIAWKASSHLAIVLKTNIENLSAAGLHFVGSDEFIIDHKLPVVRIQTVQLSGEPNKATDTSMRSLRSDVYHSLKNPPAEFHWPVHAALLRKLSKVVDVKSECNSTTIEMNGGSNSIIETTNLSKKHVSLADVSVNTTKSLTEEDEKECTNHVVETIKTPEKSPEKKAQQQEEIVVENVTVEIQHKITPKKSSLKLDLKKGTSQLSASLLNISSQIKSVTTHKRIVSSSGPKKSQPQIETLPQAKESPKDSPSQGTPKSAKTSRPLLLGITWKLLLEKFWMLIVVVGARCVGRAAPLLLAHLLDGGRLLALCSDLLHAVLAALQGCRGEGGGGALRGRAAPLLLAHLLDGGRLLALCSDLLHAVLPHYKAAEGGGGRAAWGRAAPLLLAHLLDGGRLLALCSDLLHAVLPHYKTAEVRVVGGALRGARRAAAAGALTGRRAAAGAVLRPAACRAAALQDCRGWWGARCVGRAAPLLLAHLLDGGRLLALCSDLLHAVLPHYKTAEVRVGGARCVGRAAPLLLAHLLDGGRLLALCSDLLHAVLPHYKAAEVRVVGARCVGRAAPLLLAHLLDGGRLLALCSDLLHAVLPHYKTAEVRVVGGALRGARRAAAAGALTGRGRLLALCSDLLHAVLPHYKTAEVRVVGGALRGARRAAAAGALTGRRAAAGAVLRPAACRAAALQDCRGWWGARCVGRSAPLLLAHLLDGGRLLALCSDLLHAVLPHYKTAEVRVVGARCVGRAAPLLLAHLLDGGRLLALCSDLLHAHS